MVLYSHLTLLSLTFILALRVVSGIVAPSVRAEVSTGTAALAGTLVGSGVVCLYFGAGLVVGGWSISDFFAHLSPGTVGYLVGMVVLAVAFVGLPIAGLLRFGLLAPLVVLVLYVLGWLTVGAVQGLLSVQTIFGIALYAALVSPLALGLYIVLGGSEYLLRRRLRTP